MGYPLSCRGAARRYAHMASHSMLSPLGPIGRLSTPSAARSPSAPPCVPTFGDGQPDGSSRDRAAPCRTDARSAVTASAAVLGRRRATRCAAHLQTLTMEAGRLQRSESTFSSSHEQVVASRAPSRARRNQQLAGRAQGRWRRSTCSCSKPGTSVLHNAFEFWCRSWTAARTVIVSVRRTNGCTHAVDR